MWVPKRKITRALGKFSRPRHSVEYVSRYLSPSTERSPRPISKPVNAPTACTDLVVLVNGFPRLSETFVLQELLELERRGLRLHVFALRRPAEVVQQDALSELRATVEYLPESPVPYQRMRVRLAHATLLLQRRL